jgi:hypothetical protein
LAAGRTVGSGWHPCEADCSGSVKQRWGTGQAKGQAGGVSEAGWDKGCKPPCWQGQAGGLFKAGWDKGCKPRRWQGQAGGLSEACWDQGCNPPCWQGLAGGLAKAGWDKGCKPRCWQGLAGGLAYAAEQTRAEAPLLTGSGRRAGKGWLGQELQPPLLAGSVGRG